MTSTSASESFTGFNDISAYVYGTTRLGDEKIPFDERVKVARAAMESGVWFHTSHTYGAAEQVLRAAFDQDRQKTPKLIVKLGWSSMPEMWDVTRQNLKAMGLESLDLGQLCMSGPLAEEFATGGACYAELARMKAEGLVKKFVVEVFPWTSNVPLRAIRGGYTQGIIDGYIFYLNPLQRFASNELWDELNARREAMIAMRTVSGGNVYRLRDGPGAAWKDYLQKRALEVAPVFEKSGIKSWTEFCVRFAHSFPLVRATVGSTSKPENLQEFLNAAKNVQPLPDEIKDEIVRLQYRWSDETDMKAEMWSM
jgi:aryl-alcohol dehydrogenase-like predicted oxidoreductase